MKNILIVIVLAVMAAGCKKSELELENPNQITSATYWKNEDDVLFLLSNILNAKIRKDSNTVMLIAK